MITVFWTIRFRPLHSTETTLIKVNNDLLLAADKGESFMVLLDLSAAFDTVDYSILPQHREAWFDMKESALSQSRSYLCNRTFSVVVGNSSSSVSYFIPQGIPKGQCWVHYYSSFNVYAALETGHC